MLFEDTLSNLTTSVLPSAELDEKQKKYVNFILRGWKSWNRHQKALKWVYDHFGKMLNFGLKSVENKHFSGIQVQKHCTFQGINVEMKVVPDQGVEVTFGEKWKFRKNFNSKKWLKICKKIYFFEKVRPRLGGSPQVKNKFLATF